MKRRLTPAEGHCYFMLSFADEGMSMPLVETWIFLGTNMMEADRGSAEPTWYFKSPDQFLQTGRQLGDADLDHCIRVGVDTKELVLDREGLAEQLLGI